MIKVNPANKILIGFIFLFFFVTPDLFESLTKPSCGWVWHQVFFLFLLNICMRLVSPSWLCVFLV